jgi:hypothetical protein
LSLQDYSLITPQHAVEAIDAIKVFAPEIESGQRIGRIGCA